MLPNATPSALSPSVGDTWYRYEDRTYAAPLDEYENPVGQPRTELVLYDLTVLRVTPKGVWLSLWPGATPRFVLDSARKRYAAPTKELALEGYLARKRSHVRILEAQLRRAQNALALGEALTAGKRPYHMQLVG